MKRKQTPAQLENLKKGVRITSETASEYGKRGGKARAAIKKRNQDLSVITSSIAGSEIKNEDLKQTLIDLGVEDESLLNNARVVKGVFDKATEGEITAVEKWEEWLGIADENMADELVAAEDRALALARAHYLENINSTFGAISVYALKHRYTHYEASGGRGSTKSSWASLTIVRLVMEHPDMHALFSGKSPTPCGIPYIPSISGPLNSWG